MHALHIDARRLAAEKDRVQVDLETFLIFNVFAICSASNITLIVHPVDDLLEPSFIVDIGGIPGVAICEVSMGEEAVLITYAKRPVLLIKLVYCNVLVAGICSIARQLIKGSQDAKMLRLLGFRDSCLATCSESSIWTKFCEIDMIAAVRNVALESEVDSLRKFPDDLVRFEYHLEQPVRVHNVYKLAREMFAKDLKVPHTYSEGPTMSLADVILWPLIEFAKAFFPEAQLSAKLPLIHQWAQRMAKENRDDSYFHVRLKQSVSETRLSSNNKFEYEINPDVKKQSLYDVKKQSLYTSDPSRFKPTSRPFTKQNDIANALKLVNALPISQPGLPFGGEVDFNWTCVPLRIRPEEGAVPKSRSERKKEQLENMVKAVMKVCARVNPQAKHLKIVDFCSGAGHLGLVLAHALPHCEIILVENKEKSLQRALDRIQALCMKNIVVVQANLDYFIAPYDIGVALHACGVATDLVLDSCIRNKAHFVACPCCYGGIHDCHRLQYPRSSVFKSCMQLGDYLSIAHAADQTHDKQNAKTSQGYECMAVIDNDRKKHAEEHGYEVHLGKLMPDTCTPKNDLLVGILKNVT